MVILRRCFVRFPPVQDNHFWTVPRVIVLYRFDDSPISNTEKSAQKGSRGARLSVMKMPIDKSNFLMLISVLICISFVKALHSIFVPLFSNLDLELAMSPLVLLDWSHSPFLILRAASVLLSNRHGRIETSLSKMLAVSAASGRLQTP